ncbi:hypothetical protein [Novosphingobium sp. 9]|uniref:hypothetical protein n=1 Tax=Novosphingobium sp. 9 TaxID=2025349 RepID=UPI0021B668D9|nr:hypothetical protein [Novosphingobium sp. 9]
MSETSVLPVEPGAISASDFIRRETLTSVAINTVLSLAFFLVVFRLEARVPVWGLGNLVFDTLPQSFMITLMGVLVPGLIARAKRQAGKVEALSERSILPYSPWVRAIAMALVSALVCSAIALAIFAALGWQDVNWWCALGGKLVFGAMLALVVTPVGLRAALVPR